MSTLVCKRTSPCTQATACAFYANDFVCMCVSVREQLQHLVSDEVCLQVADLYLAERKRGAAGGNLSSQCVRSAWETSFQWKAERVMAEENCFKVRADDSCVMMMH